MKHRCRSLEQSVLRKARALQASAPQDQRGRVKQWFESLDRMALYCFLAIIAVIAGTFIPWSAFQLVFGGNLPELVPPLHLTRPLNEGMSRTCLVFTGILMMSAAQEPSASIRRLLLHLPASDASIRRLESPLRYWYWLYAYSLLVFGLFQWQHGSHTAKDVLLVLLVALAQTVTTLSVSGIIRIFSNSDSKFSKTMLLFPLGMYVFGFGGFIPGNVLSQWWPESIGIAFLPTGWALYVWREGWIGGKWMSWMSCLGIVGVYGIERWLVAYRPIHVEVSSGNRLAMQWKRFRQKTQPITAAKKQPLVLESVRAAMEPAKGRSVSRKSRWLVWPLMPRDKTVLALYNIRTDRMVPTWMIVVGWCLVVPWGRCFTVLTNGQFYLASIDSLASFIMMFITSCFGGFKSGGFELPVRLADYPISYDDVVRASFRYAVAFAKRFVPGQLIFAAILVAFDGIPLHSAIGVTFGPLLLWIGLAPIAAQTLLKGLSLFHSFVPFALAMLGMASLTIVDKPRGMIGLEAVVCSIWLVSRVSRWMYFRGFAEDLIWETRRIHRDRHAH